MSSDDGLNDTAPAEPRSGVGGPEPDAIIGPYRLVRRIGEGGMGEVWEADCDRHVSISTHASASFSSSATRSSTRTAAASCTET